MNDSEKSHEEKTTGKIEVQDGNAPLHGSPGGPAAAELAAGEAPAGELAAGAEINGVEQLKQTLEEAKTEAARNYDNYLRALADAENIKKRAQRDKEQYVLYSNESMVKKLLPQLDNLEKAMEDARKNQDCASLAKGVEMIYKNITDILKSEGIECIDCLGQPFDPNFHQPLAAGESDEHPENTIIEEYQKGYKMHNRVIRPSLVKVNQPG